MHTATKAAAAAALLLFCTACAAASTSDAAKQHSDGARQMQYQTGDPAAMLAEYDGSSDVLSYTSALNEWQIKCTADRLTDAGYVDAAYRDEQQHGGPDTSRLEVMRHLTASVPASQAPTNCASIAAAYVVLVEK